MANVQLSTIEQIGFDARHNQYASWIYNPEVKPAGLWIDDAELGNVLIYYTQDDTKMYIKSSLQDVPEYNAFSWWSTFTESFQSEVVDRVASIPNVIGGAGPTLAVLIVIGVVLFLVLYAPRTR